MQDLRAEIAEPPSTGIAAAVAAEVAEAAAVESGTLDSTPRYFSDDVREWTARLRTELRHPLAAVRKLAARVVHTLLPPTPGRPHESH